MLCEWHEGSFYCLVSVKVMKMSIQLNTDGDNGGKLCFSAFSCVLEDIIPLMFMKTVISVWVGGSRYTT